MQQVPDLSGAAVWNPSNHYTRAFDDAKPGQRMPFPGFADDQQYRNYFGIAKHTGTLPRPLAFRIVYDAAHRAAAMPTYGRRRVAAPPGINRFDLHPYYAVDGRPEDFRSDRKGPAGKPRPAGSRLGPQNMVCAGWALQILKAFPGIWEERYQKQFAADVRAYIHDPVPGTTPPIRRTKLALGDVAVELYCRRETVVIMVQSKNPVGEIKICARPDGKGTWALLRYRGEEGVTVTHEGEKPLMFRRFDAGPDGSFRVFLPFAQYKPQSPWANGIEHGRFSIEAGGKRVNIYPASAEEQVRDLLAYDLGCGLRVWQEIFRTWGYIPTAVGAGDWDRYSDSGGYGHLLSAASQWLLYLDGRKDWETHRVPKVGLTDAGSNR